MNQRLKQEWALWRGWEFRLRRIFVIRVNLWLTSPIVKKMVAEDERN